MSPRNTQGKNTCNQCSFTCSSSTALDAHKVREHNGLPHRCGLCPKTFADKRNLRRHLNDTHKEKKVEYYCTKCNRIVGGRTDNARRHEKSRQKACQGHVLRREEGRPDEPLTSSGEPVASNASVLAAQATPVQSKSAALASELIHQTNIGNIDSNFGNMPGFNFSSTLDLGLDSDITQPMNGWQMPDSNLMNRDWLNQEYTGQMMPQTIDPAELSQPSDDFFPLVPQLDEMPLLALNSLATWTYANTTPTPPMISDGVWDQEVLPFHQTQWYNDPTPDGMYGIGSQFPETLEWQCC